MLDETMMYSGAIFERRDMSLEEASRAKLDRICDKLDLGPSDHVLEIGTGWGGFAVHAASTRGCRVTTTTLSREQRELALERVREAGLEDRVTILLERLPRADRPLRQARLDRDDRGGRLEGLRHVLRAAAPRCWRPDGVMALQAITIDDRLYDVEKAQRSFMNSLIFPNGCLPSVEVIARNVARRSDLRMVDLEDITPHYAETLRRWRANVDAHADRIRALGYDERFLRLWRLYLCFCEAGFTERRIGNVQIVLAKPRWRGHLATAEAPAQPSMVGERVKRARARRARLPGRLRRGAARRAARRSCKSWLGPTTRRRRRSPCAASARARSAIHGVGIAAVLRGADVRPWLAVSIAGRPVATSPRRSPAAAGCRTARRRRPRPWRAARPR